MTNRKWKHIEIGGEDYSQHLAFPFLIQKALDESLDFAVVELHNTRRRLPFKPFTPVTIGHEDVSTSFVVAIDEVSTAYGTNRYKHTITVMEATKATERIMCGAKAFTNPLVRDYTDGKTLVRGVLSAFYQDKGDSYEYEITTYDNIPVATMYKSPINDDNITIYADDFGIGLGAVSAATVKIVYENGNSPITKDGDGFFIKKSAIKYSKSYAEITNVLDIIPRYGTGVHGVIYDITFSDDSKRTIYFEIAVTEKPASRDPYTVEDVVEILLDTSETLRDGLDSPRYRLRYKSVDQRKKFQQAAPEFRFSNGRSLWECLREVGQYVHAIPRAVHDLTDGLDYIEFDELGATKYADLSKGTLYGQGSTITVGDYTAGLEAMAANLVNLDDEDDGSVTEPFTGGFVSIRAATEAARIEEGTGIIKTAHPIEKIIKVEVGAFNAGGKAYQGGDITPYIFAKTEYDILSGFSGAYPTSKTYALYYTQGSPNIEGLWYKAQDTGAEALNALEDYSITNVITAVTGAPSGILRGLDYPNLMFRVTYIPSVTARVRQYKPDYDGAFPSVLAHNQSANKLSARAFGENLRGQLAMMGNASERVNYIFKRPEDLPEAGELYDDDHYISSITERVYHDFVLAQISLSKGYNELGSRVEINNAIRQFEIPAAEDRYTVLEEFCEIGVRTADDGNLAMTSALRTEVLQAFGSQAPGRDVSLAEVTTYDEDGNAITSKPVALPVISLALGTSLYFGWRFEDNFAAGSKSSPGASGCRVQDYVPYGDPFYAQAHSVGFKLISGATAANALQTAHSLPESSGINLLTVMADTGKYPILWHKDSADAGCLSYQLHYITNDGLIIGDGIAYHCAAVRRHKTDDSAKIYFYDHRINQLTGTTETSAKVYDLAISSSSLTVTYTDGVKPTGFKSWAIIKGGRFMLGKNSAEEPTEIYFNFKRRFTE